MTCICAVSNQGPEWPKEVGSLLEVRANGNNLVNEVLNREGIVFAELLVDYGFRGGGGSASG